MPAATFLILRSPQLYTHPETIRERGEGKQEDRNGDLKFARRMEAAKKQHEMAKTLISAMEKAKSMLTCILTTLIIIDVELPIDHHRPILHRHRYASPSVCIDTITIDHIIIDVSINGTVGRANGL